MFSDPVDDFDTQSFDEDDMYGSDPNAETIPLKSVSEVQDVSNNDYCVCTSYYQTYLSM
jgi:hypothetical protein